ncbi:MAG: hypothetical protein HY835_08275 [Anaerolineae bacterium]|nr:hypothetical protein [Anaerolineae bacterium]
MIILRLLAAILGVGLIMITLRSAMRTFVVPRNIPDGITHRVFDLVRLILDLLAKATFTFRQRDAILAWYAPLALLALLPVWYILVMVGYALLFWATGASSIYTAVRDSGSSLLTLGFEPVFGWSHTLLALTEAAIGLILVALLISYLPTIYSAFSRRENAVTLLEVRAGDPPSAETMLLRYQRIHGLDRLTTEWERWEIWFADIQESHTSLPMLAFFRSPYPEHSWLTASGVVMDAAALLLSAVDRPFDAQAALCIRGGYLALRSIADNFNIPYHNNPDPTEPISIRREEFDAVIANLKAEGVPLKPDLDQAWRDYSGWRVNYDTVLIHLAGFLEVPHAPWSSDRAVSYKRKRLLR